MALDADFTTFDRTQSHSFGDVFGFGTAVHFAKRVVVGRLLPDLDLALVTFSARLVPQDLVCVHRQWARGRFSSGDFLDGSNHDQHPYEICER
jgi:hypothetical protein